MDTAQLIANGLGIAGLVGCALVGLGCDESSPKNSEMNTSLRAILGSDPADSAHTPEPNYTVVINATSDTPRLSTGTLDRLGNPVTIACSTCHTSREPNINNANTADLDEFHQGLVFSHGQEQVSCLSCHNAEDYDSLRLANGTAIGYADSMTLCSQCHGSQHRDYQHGAHGGMNGYWDLSRGPRSRNTCVDCHDPHAPAFPSMVPTFKPIDRFLNAPHVDGQEHRVDGHDTHAPGSEEHEG
jgi:formate-dependent nitrite reductase cytochrome c552 subunit